MKRISYKWPEGIGTDVMHNLDGVKIPAALIGIKRIDDELYPIIQYLAPDGELYPVKERPYWLEQTMVVYPEEIAV